MADWIAKESHQGAARKDWPWRARNPTLITLTGPTGARTDQYFWPSQAGLSSQALA